MPRKPRLIGRELYHHIYAWGNDKHQIFRDTAHFEKYLELLELYSARYDIDIVAYGLMNWHIHLFLLDLFGRLSRFMRCLHGRYAQFFNKSTGQVGHVFGERFNNKVVQANNYGLWLSRYIHRQAIEAGTVKDPKDYRWTSYRAYLGLAPEGFLKPRVILSQFGAGRIARRRYEEFVVDEKHSPVDWNGPSVSVIGDDEFTDNITKSKHIDRDEKTNIKDLIEILSHKLGVRSELLLNPRGRVERQYRHEAFLILLVDYKLTAAEVARAFGVSPNAVTKVLRK